MKKLIQVLGLLMFGLPVLASQHHSGHAGGPTSGGESVTMDCEKGRISKPNPAHLAEVEPGSDFSVWVSGVDNFKDIELSVKKIPLEFTVEDRNSFVILHGKLPPELKNTAARVTVKMKNKLSKCNAEDGWLLKIKP